MGLGVDGGGDGVLAAHELLYTDELLLLEGSWLGWVFGT